MKKRFKIISAVVIVLIAGFFGGYLYVMKGGERNLQTEDTAYKVNAADLSAEFSQDAEKATKKYLNKAVEIRGTVTSGKDKEVVLNSNIVCTMQQPVKTNASDNVSIKGRILGFDDLMGEIKLDQCYLTK